MLCLVTWQLFQIAKMAQRLGRLQRECQMLQKAPPAGVSCWPEGDKLDVFSAGKPYGCWHVVFFFLSFFFAKFVVCLWNNSSLYICTYWTISWYITTYSCRHKFMVHWWISMINSHFMITVRLLYLQLDIRYGTIHRVSYY